MPPEDHTRQWNGRDATMETTMFASVLQRLHSQGHLDVAKAAQATGLDPSTIYKWIAGATEPGVTNASLLVRHCHDPQVQAALLGVFTAGTPWVASYLPTELDINGDGDVDTRDALIAAIDALDGLAEHLRGVQDVGAKHAISSEELAHIHEHAESAVQGIVASQRVIQWLHDQQQRRRPARRIVGDAAQI